VRIPRQSAPKFFSIPFGDLVILVQASG